MKITRFFLLIILLFLTFISMAPAQETAEEGSGPQQLPNGFRDITLGKGLEAVKAELKSDPYFHYRGEPDVTLLPRPNYTVIECEGAVFIARGFFQFHEKELYIIILMLDREKIDYFTMYTTLKEKYGDPSYLDPEQVVWENKAVRMSLERPLQIKYVELETFEQLKQTSEAEESMEQYIRDRFLEQF